MIPAAQRSATSSRNFGERLAGARPRWLPFFFLRDNPAKKAPRPNGKTAAKAIGARPLGVVRVGRCSAGSESRASAALLTTVIVVVAVPPISRVTVGVPKVQVASAGSPEQVSCTGPAKLWKAETVTI